MKRSIVSFFCFSLFEMSTVALDVFNRTLVYKLPAMQKVQMKETNANKTVSDNSLHFDLSYPENNKSKGALPFVVFINFGSLDVPRWRVYKDWAKLVATRGMAAVLYQCRNY